MAGWLDIILTNRSFDLVVGAILATLGGYFATQVQQSRQRKSTRRGLGTILHAQLIYEAPRDDPIFRDPHHAIRISLRSLPAILEPGVLNPVRDEHIMMDLISLAAVVDEFNERALLWDEAYAAGADDEKLQILYNALQLKYWDYRELHANILVQLWQLGPPMQLSDEYVEPTFRTRFREKVDRWRTRKVRQAWIDYEAREKAEHEELARLFSPMPTHTEIKSTPPPSV